MEPAGQIPTPNSDESNPHAPHIGEATVEDDEVVEMQLRPPHPNVGWAILWTLLILAVHLAVVIAFGIVAVAYTIAQGRQLDQQIQHWLTGVVIPLVTFATLATALLVVFIFYRWEAAAKIGVRGMSVFQWIFVLATVLPLAILASEVTNCAAEVVPTFEVSGIAGFINQPAPLIFIAGCLLPGLGEEIYFRGFLSRGLVANHGLVWGTLFAAFLFGIVHVEPIQASGAFFIGIALQYLFLTTRSLAAPIVLHIANNALAFGVMKYPNILHVPGFTPGPDGTVVHTPIPLLLASVLVLVVIFGLFYQTRTRWMLPDGEWWPGYVTAEQPPKSINAIAISAPPLPLLLLTGIAGYAALVGALVWAIQ